MKKYYNLSIYSAKISVPFNATMAVGKILLGIFSFSIFLCINAFYNIGIALAKYFAVRTHNDTINNLKNVNTHLKPNSCLSSSTDITDVNTDLSLYLNNKKIQNDCYTMIGIIIIVSSIAYILCCIRMFFSTSGTQYPTIVGIAIATFTFTELFASSIGANTMRRERETMLEAVKLTNFASSLISLVLTQTAILSFSFEGNASFYNGISGVVFGSLASLIGIYMLIRIYRIKKGKYLASLIKKVSRLIKKIALTRQFELINFTEEDTYPSQLYIKMADEDLLSSFEKIKKKVKKKCDIELIRL